MPQITLIRHGESEWNKEDRFTGWADIDITARGREQIRFAARQLLAAGIEFDIAFTSVLKRCIRSQWTLLDAMDCMWLPQVNDWRLNERHYGALTGMSVAAAIEKYGAEEIYRWRRSYEFAPPPLENTALLHGLHGTHGLPDRRYAGLSAEQCLMSESLKDTKKRIGQVWHGPITQCLKNHQRVLIVGHGNSLRSFVKLIEGISKADITDVEVPNATPIVYTLDGDLKCIEKRLLSGLPQRPSGIL